VGKWKKVRLSDIVDETITGEWGTECADDEVGTRVLRTTNFTNSGVINYNNVVVRNIAASKVEKKKLKKNDIILEKSGGSDNQPVGRVVFFENEPSEVFLCNNFTQVLRIEPSIAFPRYVFFYLFRLHQNGTTELLQNKTTGIRNLQVKQYMALDIPLPPLEVQRQIADVLDRASALIEKRKAQIEKLDLLVKSQFIEMFVTAEEAKTWKTVTMQCVSTDMRTGPFGSALLHDEFVDEGIFVLGIDNAVENKFSYNRMRYITEGKYQQLKRYTVKPLDVIITIMGTIGRSAVIPLDMPKAINTKHLACITIDHNIANPFFISAAFQTHPDIRQQLHAQKKGAIMDGLNLTIIKRLSFSLPPLTLQNDFATFVERVEAQKALLQKGLAKLEINYKSLMQKCFIGEVF